MPTFSWPFSTRLHLPKFPWDLLLLASLYFTREVNLSRYLGWPTLSAYTDIVLSPAWLALAAYVVAYSAKLNRNWLGLLMTFNLLLAAPLTRGAMYWWLHTWIILLGYLLITRRTWRTLGWVLLPVFLFDHALISSPYPVVTLLTYQLLRRTKRERCVYPLLILNLLLALYQTATGESRGFHWLGEKYLDLTTNGVAKTTLGPLTLLRGYGLFAHPIILGTFGLISLRFVCRQLPARMATALVLLSQSRAALLSFLGLVRVRWLWLLVPLLLALFALRLPTSDSYRGQDLAHYVRYVEDHPRELLLGTGAGQYAHVSRRIQTSRTSNTNPSTASRSSSCLKLDYCL